MPTTLHLPIRGLCCAEEARAVQEALSRVPGVVSVDVLLAAEKAIVQADPTLLDLDTLRRAVEGAGCSVGSPPVCWPDLSPGRAGAGPSPEQDPLTPPGNGPQLAASPAHLGPPGDAGTRRLSRSFLAAFGLVGTGIVGAVVLGEWSGVLDGLTHRIPWPIWAALIALGGWPILRKVVRAALQGKILAHTLMTVGLSAAVAVQEWGAALLVVLFMRVSDAIEAFTASRSRQALRSLLEMAPKLARVERGGQECEIPAEEIRPGEIVVVRPGGQIPVDGEVVEGNASVDQAALTGEPLPLEAGPGSRVLAASVLKEGMLRVRAERVGADTTFGRVIRLVEEAEAHRGEVQRLADRFSTWYLPVVLGVAGLTVALRGEVLAAAAVLVVACSCAFAMATPVAVLAAVGNAARRGLVIKGGRYLEALAQADVLLLDKTGTLTLGQPRITDVVPLDGTDGRRLLALAASAEWYSEHPLAQAVREAAREWGVEVARPEDFRHLPGRGVAARVRGEWVEVGRGQAPEAAAATAPALRGGPSLTEAPLDLHGAPRAGKGEEDAPLPLSPTLLRQGKTILPVRVNGRTLGFLAAADTLRPEVPEALAALRALGLRHIELLTGDHAAAAAAIAEPLGLKFRAGLLPEEKIAVVKDYQRRGHRVVVVGDGVNDAPALAQADVGIAMGAAGTPVAMEAAHVVLMGDDWRAVPALFRLARKTMGVVRLNLAFTAAYNLAGLSLAALGYLPLVLAAAAQSLPDLGIMANSSRLLRESAWRGSGQRAGGLISLASFP